MLKLVRLLRLGRMITYLKANKSFKFGAKLLQLLFMLLLIIHWIACLWHIVTTRELSWFPAKDLDARITIIFTGTYVERYLIFFYYSVITLVSNDLLPTNMLEVAIAGAVILAGCIILGIIIAEFSNILQEMGKEAKQKTEELDMVSAVMTSL